MVQQQRATRDAHAGDAVSYVLQLQGPPGKLLSDKMAEHQIPKVSFKQP